AARRAEAFPCRRRRRRSSSARSKCRRKPSRRRRCRFCRRRPGLRNLSVSRTSKHPLVVSLSNHELVLRRAQDERGLESRDQKSVMHKLIIPAVVAGIVASSFQLPSKAAESPILTALRDELKRSMTGLRLKDEPSPYYIDYDVEDISNTRVV